jgi:hypothetical protein
MKDGSVRRRPADECELLIDKGQAKRYISNTIYRAMSLGIEVKNFNDRDEKGVLRGKIRDLTQKAEAKRKKKEAKKKAETEEVDAE